MLEDHAEPRANGSPRQVVAFDPDRVPAPPKPAKQRKRRGLPASAGPGVRASPPARWKARGRQTNGADEARLVRESVEEVNGYRAIG